MRLNYDEVKLFLIENFEKLPFSLIIISIILIIKIEKKCQYITPYYIAIPKILFKGFSYTTVNTLQFIKSFYYD